MLWPAKPDKDSSYWGALRWCLTSDEQLLNTEAHLLSGVKSIEEGVFVDIGPVIDPAGDRVLTYIANKAALGSVTPLLLVHGFAGGAGLWSQNIDALAKDRTVYAIDVVGFGRSSRPTFSSNPMEAEDEFISTIEAWRKVMGLEKIYLLGHSFGGYLSTLYAMKYPERVEHLVLVDPWGFPARPPSYKLPVWALPIEFGAACVLPLFALRAAGPLGYLYLRLVPPFNTHNFRSVSNAKRTTTDYFYHLNCKKPSGEIAFHRLMEGIAWARFPMLPRFHGLRKEVPITFIYGEKSWVWRSSGFKVQEMRPDSYVDVEVVAAAGHVVSSDQPQVFNAVVSRVLRSIDLGETPANVLTRSPPVGKCLTGPTVLGPSSTDEGHSASVKEHPSTEQEQSSTELDQSSTELEQSSTELEQPSTELEQPSTELEQPGTEQEQPSTEQEQSSTEQEQSNTDENWLSVECVVSSTDDVWLSADEGHPSVDQEHSITDLKLSMTHQEVSTTIQDLSIPHQIFSNSDQEFTGTCGSPASTNKEDYLSRVEDDNEFKTYEQNGMDAPSLGPENGIEHLTIDDDFLQRPGIKSKLFEMPSSILHKNFSSTRSTLFSEESEPSDRNFISAQRVGPKRKKGKLHRNRNKNRSDIATNSYELIN